MADAHQALIDILPNQFVQFAADSQLVFKEAILAQHQAKRRKMWIGNWKTAGKIVVCSE